MSAHDVTIEPTFDSWRLASRELLRRGFPPASIVWHESTSKQTDLLPQQTFDYFGGFANSLLARGDDASAPTNVAEMRVPVVVQSKLAKSRGPAPAQTNVAESRVPKEFLNIAESVACHSDNGRWHALYCVLYRLTNGEPSLLEVATDPDVYRLLAMHKAVKRAVHKMHAFVRFRGVETSQIVDGKIEHQTTYIAWFEPLHHVVQRAVPLFVRRFASMRWSILTPVECAHWDGSTVHFTPGVSRAMAPREDELEELWRSYYAHIFNPARVAVSTMQAEMPRQYWRNLPEARLIRTLTQDAGSRVARMLAQLDRPAAEIPEELRSQVGDVTVPDRNRAAFAANTSNASRNPALSALFAALDTPGEWDTTHDPGVTAASNRARVIANAEPQCEQVLAEKHCVVNNAAVRIGTASWTDPTILQPGVFYPSHVTTPEQRLQHYSSQYGLVEVDSTFYVPPVRSIAAAWAARTPAEFVFDIKAFALMTGHPAEVKRMPDWLRRMLPKSANGAERVYAKDFRTADVDEIWNRFVAALDPLSSAGKLGPILLQFPRWFEPSRSSADALRAARERLGNTAAAVEFRNPAWVEGRVGLRTVGLLEKLELTYVVVDAPGGTRSSMPPVAHVTTPHLSVVRLHGRRQATWEARNEIVSERYRYLYDHNELGEWSARIGGIAERLHFDFPDMAKAKQGVHVVFNNCHANYGTTNTDEITALLRKFDRQRQMI